jgi:sulfonate transport system substrate-binding protein
MPFIKALNDGVDLVTFANIFSADNINSIVARKDAGIDKLSDLAGKTIATEAYSAVHFFLYKILKAYELNDKGIKLEFMPGEAMPLALADGKIDAFSLREPYVSQARDLLGDRVTVLHKDGLYHQYELLASTRKILEKKPRAFEKFVRGMLKAQQFSYEQPEQAINIEAQFLEVSPQKIKSSWVAGSVKVGLQQGLLVNFEDQQSWLDPLELVALPAEKNFMNYFYFPVLAKVAPGLIGIIYDSELYGSLDKQACCEIPENSDFHLDQPPIFIQPDQ